MTETPGPFDDAALARFLTGECTPEETRLIGNWLRDHPAHAQQLEQVRDAWAMAAARRAPRFDVSGMRQEIERRLAGSREGGRSSTGHRTHFADVTSVRGPGRRQALIAAAGVVLVAGLTWRVARRDVPETPPAPTPRQIVTARGQRSDVYLSDGTHVLLAPESRLRFDSPLGTPREVTLDGEAVFEVTHDDSRPFRVRTAAGTAEDLGTRFNVRQYPGERQLRVVVSEGRVSLAGVGESRGEQLGAGDLGIVSADGRVTVQRAVDLEKAFGWVSGRITFEAVPLREAIRELRRYYDTDFLIASEAIGNRRLTASFGPEGPLEVARVIALSLDARFEQRGKTITFAPKRKEPEQ